MYSRIHSSITLELLICSFQTTQLLTPLLYPEHAKTLIGPNLMPECKTSLERLSTKHKHLSTKVEKEKVKEKKKARKEEEMVSDKEGAKSDDDDEEDEESSSSSSGEDDDLLLK